MNRLEKLYEVTLQLNDVISETVPPKSREEVIQKINQLIDERAIIMEKVTPPYSEDEKQIGKKIVDLNETIKEKMNQLFVELKADIKSVKKRKESNRSYINPYGRLKTTDGMYVDSKQ